ncbi:LAETG motif-containing sortase-dependent surface protein [Kitasatospora cineracea]|uniref:LAETG motif-containing sortase-dependent surface protein n=1 Tax=Kitasatospora cineracea TaxID=88074 RepID=UPI00341D2E00
MSVRTRRARLASFAAAVVLGATVPVLAGASSAWACGDEPQGTAVAPVAAVSPAAPAAGVSTAEVRTVTPEQAADKLRVDVVPGQKSVRAGGDPVVFDVRITNSGDATVEAVVPALTFFNEAATTEQPKSTLLKEDLVLEVNTSAGWKTLALHPNCDPVLRPEVIDRVGSWVQAGQSITVQYRLSVTGHSNPDQAQVDVRAGVLGVPGALAGDNHLLLPITHPAAPTTPAPTTPAPTSPAPTSPAAPAPTAPAAASTPPAVAQAALTGTAASPAAGTATTVPTTDLASTGGGSSATPMLLGGTALVLLGAGAIIAVRRRTAGR